MSSPKMPPDNSMAIRQMEMQQQEQARLRDEAAKAARKEELLGLRNTAQSTGRQSAMDYFTGKGLDSSAYGTDIDATINSILGGIAPDDPNPGSYFSNAGPTAYSRAEEGSRAKASRGIDALFAPNFETSRVQMTLDDPYLDAIKAEQRTSADNIIRNMLSRGVITNTGYDAAFKDLDRQDPSVRARLTEVGNNQLLGQQNALRDIANEGRSTATTLNLGTQFDPSTYGKRADDSFAAFMSGLSDSLRAAAPGDLYNTGNLSAVAGSGQGAQNTAFDPEALAGITADPTEAEKKKADAAKAAIF